jgi:hypothetical protein
LFFVGEYFLMGKPASRILTPLANLATFTQYHAIRDRQTFWSYVAFFTILWTTWFHVVCFDARFAFDSVWERACKIVHFCIFATFALVGYKFNLLTDTVYHWVCILWIYCEIWSFHGSSCLGFSSSLLRLVDKPWMACSSISHHRSLLFFEAQPTSTSHHTIVAKH